MKKALIKLIDWYQKYSRGFYRTQVCVFYPTCSEYTKEAIDKYGAIKGSVMGVSRIFRCHPWQKNHIDPVP
jgi:uncharacterized protein